MGDNTMLEVDYVRNSKAYSGIYMANIIDTLGRTCLCYYYFGYWRVGSRVDTYITTETED